VHHGVRAPTVIAFLTAAICCLTMTGAAGATRLPFEKLAQGTSRLPIFGGRAEYEISALVVDPLGQTLRPQDLQLELGKKDTNTIADVDWRRRFAIGVISSLPTRGYSINIYRVALQHIGGGATQLCVIASRRGPAEGRVVLQEPTSTYSFVSVARTARDALAPTTVVLRGAHGRLLYVTRDSGPFDNSAHRSRPDVCRP
jgi:hypothetical protein